MSIEFTIGTIIGALIGIVLMCLVQINREKTDTNMKAVKFIKFYCEHKKCKKCKTCRWHKYDRCRLNNPCSWEV